MNDHEVYGDVRLSVQCSPFHYCTPGASYEVALIVGHNFVRPSDIGLPRYWNAWFSGGVAGYVSEKRLAIIRKRLKERANV